MEINDSLVHELFLNPELRKSDTRTVIFLLSNPGALSSDELSKGIGISGKSVNKSIKRLVAAGIIQLGEPQAKKRTFIVQLSEQKEPQEVTEKENRETFDSFMDRFDRIEEMIASMMGTKGACFNPAPAPDGQEVTGKVSHLSCDDEQKNIQDKKNSESIPKVTEPVSVVIESGTNEPQNDSIVSDLDTALLHAGARLAALKEASLLKEKQSSFSDTCSPARVEDTFRELFGVHVPPGFTDMAAVETMVNRKKSWKLDNVKSPLAYLSSLAGKVQSPIQSISTELNPESQMSVKKTPEMLSSVNARLSHVDMAQINSMWDAMDQSQYKAAASARDQTGKKYPVPVELLARQIFNSEMMSAQGVNYGKGN